MCTSCEFCYRGLKNLSREAINTTRVTSVRRAAELRLENLSKKSITTKSPNWTHLSIIKAKSNTLSTVCTWMGDCYNGFFRASWCCSLLAGAVLYHSVRPGFRACIACTAILPDNLIGHHQSRIPTTIHGNCRPIKCRIWSKIVTCVLFYTGCL
jgi:hypothetical protein